MGSHEAHVKGGRVIERRIVLQWCSGLTLAWMMFLSACAHDTYEQRADTIKDHSEAFYTHLKANHVESAIRENEQIEAMASEMGRTVRRRASLQGAAPVEREFALMKTAHEAAASNWLALGQYFAIKKQYAQARATYQRILNTYNDPTDQPYREQAARALEDLKILNPPSASATHP
jgi:tetratricopeptide (TPR) repeat protein